jgi:hypothetical protein
VSAQAFTKAVIASVMAAAAAKIERIAETAFMAFSPTDRPSTAVSWPHLEQGATN